MADVSGSYVRGLLLAREIVPWAAQSSYTEQSPIPGYPVASAATDLRLVASGTPTGTSDYQVRCQHAGVAGQIDHGATYAVRRAGELWLGHEQAGVIAAWETVDYPTRNLSVPAICALPNGTMVIVAESGATCRVYTRDASTYTWTDRSALPNSDWLEYPCLVVVDTDVYCIAWATTYTWDPATPGSTRHYYLRVWRSTDSGATWETVQDAANTETDVRQPTVVAAGSGTPYSLGRIRAAYRDGQVIVLAHLRRHALDDDLDVIRQWAGSSLLARLELVGTYQGSSSDGWGFPDVVATPAGFVVAFLQRNDGVRIAQLGSAWQPLNTAAPGLVTLPVDVQPANGWSAVGAGTARTWEGDDFAEVALAYDPAGAVWLYVQAATSGPGGNVHLGAQFGYYSSDGGSTWTQGHSTSSYTADVSGYWWWPEDDAGHAGTAGNYPYRLYACWHRGRVVIAHGWYADVSGDSGARVGVAYLGGFTDLVLPYEGDGIKIGQRVGWIRQCLPFEEFDSQDFTLTTAGVAGNTIATIPAPSAFKAAQSITTGDGAGLTGTRWYEWQGASITQQHGLMEWSVRVTNGGSSTTCEIGGRMRLASNNHGVEVEICLTSTGIYIRDFVAGIPLGSVAGLVSTKVYSIRLGMDLTSDTGAGRDVTVWYREHDTSEKRRWTEIGTWTLADDAGAGGAVPWIRWGHIIAGGAGTQNASYWQEGPRWCLPRGATSETVGTYGLWHDLVRATDYPAELAGKPLGTEADWAMDGVTLAGRRGPGWINAQWTITPTGEYSVQRGISLVSPSPRLGWRSVGATTQYIAWAADPDNAGVEDCAHPPMIGLAVYGGNHRRARLDSRSAAGVWTTRLDVSTALLDGVAFTRTGNVLSPAATGTVYLHRDECAGWYVELVNGATIRRRKVVGNDEGRWSNAGTEPVARLYLDDIVTTDPGGGGAQTLTLWPDAWVGMVRGLSCAAWRLYLDSAYATFEGDVRAKVFFGPVHLFGLQPSWGRGIELEAGHELPELEGRVPVRIDRSLPRQQVTIGWDEGVDTREVYGTTASRYVTPSSAGGTEPTAALAATPGSLLHALRRHGGRPVVYLPAIARSAATTWILNRRDQHMLATIASGPTLQPFLGAELQDEVQRVAALELLEIR